MDHIEVVATMIGYGAKKVLVEYRDGKSEWISRKDWEKMKEGDNWTTDF